MKHPSLAGLVSAAAMMLAGSVMGAQARSPDSLVRAPEITRTLKGKVCTSRVGATFAFGQDGHYAYDGLWTDHGHYRIHDGTVTIMLDSGLEKSFAISRRNGVLFMEDTAVSCA
ncbi:hypothetical protein MHY87_08565 [Microvirga sp. ACRRW]|uniref:hypothetical protein n=1 Tax=Microvirga sp. ACRRW TaxID=2918205 RepID=UPI001EF43824|nr:hypothetical protein [Microvirga sp. ACRRW]MCG7392954.1 hypothetical protein [Microvirga sp. ACRRW]